MYMCAYVHQVYVMCDHICHFCSLIFILVCIQHLKTYKTGSRQPPFVTWRELISLLWCFPHACTLKLMAPSSCPAFTLLNLCLFS